MIKFPWAADHVLLRGLEQACVLLWVFCISATAPRGWADEPPNTSSGVLQLSRGDFVTGRLSDHAGSDHLAWQHPAFDGEFLFPLRAVISAGFPEPAEVTRAEGEFCVELINGDRWYGSVAGIDGDVLTLRSPTVGDLPIHREMLSRLFRWENGETLLYSGPGALSAWQQSGGEAVWDDLGGQLRTDQTLASIYNGLGLPDRAQIEIEISWSGTPNFVVAIGVDERPSSIEKAFRVEVWNQTLVLIRESKESAEILAIGTLDQFHERLWLSISLDQTTGHAIVYSERGKRLGELQPTEDAQQSLPGIRVENIEGNVQLELLQVMTGGAMTGEAMAGNTFDADARPTPSTSPEGDRFRLNDGRTFRGRLLRIEEETWIIADEDQEQAIDPATILAADFNISSDRISKKPAADDEQRLRVATYSGFRATGSLEKIENEKLYVQADGIEGSVPLNVVDLRSLNMLNSTLQPSTATGTFMPDWYNAPATPDADAEKAQAPDELDASAAQAQRIGRLEIDGTRLHGRLVDAEATAETSAIRFRPLGAADAAALRGGTSGRLIYRDREPEPTANQHAQKRERAEKLAQAKRAWANRIRANRIQVNQARANQGLLGPVAVVFEGGRIAADTTAATQLPTTSLHLRCGDLLPCEIKQIDAGGVTFDSPIVGATHVPHDQVRAVTLTAGSVADIDESKRERLLTVPRMRKTSPPTHLIVSSDGDFLRGRLHNLDEQTLLFENRLETIEIPRRLVSQILWFHADELAKTESAKVESAEKPPAASPDGSDPQSPLRVQSVHRNGVRLTFEPRQVGGGELIGESAELGLCLVSLGTIDQLLIGREIEAEVAESPYHDWRLTHAPEPKVLQEDAAGKSPEMRSAGVDSPLIGTAAPEFALELLAGGTFRLSEQRGKIVVLDFWATWCGPCIQSMPQVEEAVAAFPEDGVVLVAVNLQETADQIRAALERLKWNPAVALDIDGVVASQYHATAIPQTVVIDREGRVTRLFIGGSAQLGEQLREAIEEAMKAP